MLKLFALGIVLFVGNLNGQTINKLQFRTCHTAAQTPIASISLLDISPMPIMTPGNHTLQIKGKTTRVISGNLKTTLAVSRFVAGLNLPIRCYLVGGVYTGSCTWNDFCKDFIQPIASLTPETCSPDAAPYGIDCTCPFRVNQLDLDLTETIFIDVGSIPALSFVTVGDFDITISATDAQGFVGCFNVKLAIKF